MSSYDEAFKVLQRKFIDKLPEYFACLRESYIKLNGLGWQSDVARQLHHQLHSLTGSAGTFGLQSLCAAARQLETHLKAIIAAAEAPDTEKWQIIGTELSQLEHISSSWFDSVAVHVSPPIEIHTPSTNPLIYLIEDDTSQAEKLAQSLRKHGFRLQVFTQLADFRAAWQQGPKPDALVLDMIFPEGENAGVELLLELKAASEQCPPVVITSLRDDLTARLAAYRAGASRYLSKPFNEKNLNDILDSLTGRLPAQPYRVMLVDDDPLLLQVQSAVLQQAGMVVQALSKPGATLDLLDSFNPDVLVLDVFMPDIHGTELAAIVREREAYLQLPILFLSAETDLSQQLIALNLGGDDFLVKPVQPQHLVLAIVARAQRKRQNEALNLRLQHTLYEREREHQALNLHAIVSVADIAGRITYVNDLFCQVSGYNQHELLGQNHRIVKSTKHSAQFYKQIWSTISSGQAWHGEICNQRKDGNLYWVMSTITPLIGDNGKPYQYISVRTDITLQKFREQTERKQNAIRSVLAEAAELLLSADYLQLDNAIKQALGLFASCLELDRGCLFKVCADEQHISISHEWCAQGVASQKPLFQNMPLNNIPWFWQQIVQGKAVVIGNVNELPAQALAEKTMFQSLDVEALCCFPMQRQGKSIGFIGFDQINKTRDWQQEYLEPLTMLASLINSALLRGASEQLKNRSVAKLNATLESTKDGILAVDHTGKILFMNRQFRDIWRLAPELLTDSSDETLLEHALAQLVDPKGFMLKVRALYRSGEESEDLIELTDGRIFERHSKPLFGYGKNTSRVWSFHDITERRKAEEMADSAKERLRRGQLYANIGTWEWNIVTGDLVWTERIAPLFGYPQGNLATSYENFLAAVHPDDRQVVIDAVMSCIDLDVPYDIEHRVVWPDGTVRWLLERGAVRRDARGKAILMTGVVQDINDRKCAELALAEREQQLLEAQQLAHLGNWQLDLHTLELIWSEEVYRIFGYDPFSVKLSVDLFQDAVHPDDHKLITDAQKLAEKTGLYDVTHRIILSDGSIRHLHERAKLQLDAEGKPLRLVGTVQDLTVRFKAEQRLHESEQRFAFAVEGAGDGIWDWDIARGTMLLSDQYERMLGFAPGEIEPNVAAWQAAVHPDDIDGVSQRLNAYLAGNLSSYDVELRLKTKCGEYKWVLCRGTIVARNESGEPSRVIGIHSDISKRKQLEFALLASREAAEQANQAKSEFLSSMSHELRTPMNAILGFGQLMEYDDSLPDEHKDNVHEILKAGSHLLDLINEVLDLAKVESGTINLSLEPVAVFSVVQECKSLLITMAEQRNITLNLECIDNNIVMADRTRLKQILLNLLSNAIKYNRKAGSVCLDVLQIDKQRLRLSVHDTGNGIAQDQLAGLFHPFNRLGAESSEIEGTGIGLTITKRLIEMMGGSLGVESEPGVGSCFWFELPLAQQMLQTHREKITQLEEVSTDCCGEECQNIEHNVLYIEDNPANIKLITQLLATLPHMNLQSAHTASLGVELAMSFKPDLILLDINMPGMDGFQVLQVLQAERTLQHIPVIAITANAMPRDIERGKQAGFREYITKPINIDHFISVVQQNLDQAKKSTIR